ncbi:MAG: oligosaccharide flippase family protein [Alcanivorax jadensis]|uniref:oligosaccharide flippase family protein n=1 Tax=Alcanivorax jadensis TaxID=64988 RepID=UPI00300137B6
MNSDSNQSLKKTGVDIVLTFARQFLAGFLQLGIIMLVARELDAEGLGAYSVSLLIPTVLSQLLNLGLVASNVYYISSQQYQPATVWAVSRNVGAVISISGTVMAAIVVWAAGEKLFPGVPLAVLLLAVTIFPLALMSGLISSFFQAWQDFRAFNILVLIQPVVALCGTGWLVIQSQLNLESLLYATIASHFVTVCIAGYKLNKRIPLLVPRNLSQPYLGLAIRYGIKAHLGGIATLLINRSDIFMVNFFLGAAAAGVYTAASRIIQQLWLLSQAVSTVAFPRLSRMPQESAERLNLLSLMSSVVFWGAGAIAFFIYVFSDWIIAVFFGVGFEAAEPVLMILLVGVLVFSSSRVLANDFAARNLVHLNLSLTTATLLINISANLFLIPLYGLHGAAMATSGAYVINFIARLFLQQKTTGFVWWRSVYPDYYFALFVKKVLK